MEKDIKEEEEKEDIRNSIAAQQSNNGDFDVLSRTKEETKGEKTSFMIKKQDQDETKTNNSYASSTNTLILSSSSSPSFQFTTHDGLYGQVVPVETPELLASKFQELNEALQKIPDKAKKDWLVASQEKCPELCDNTFKLMFLRCELFNCDLAAKRIAKYWKKRVEIFGESKAFVPLILGENGPYDGDEECMKIGFVCSTEKRDAAGRLILFSDPSVLPEDKSSYDTKSMCRAIWYVMDSVLADEITQRKGVVIIAYPKNVKLSHSNPKLEKMYVEAIKGCLPVRISALHICNPPWVFLCLLSVFKILMGAKLRKKIQINSGDEVKVLEKFESIFGISRTDLPIVLGGSLLLNHGQWLRERLEKGL